MSSPYTTLASGPMIPGQLNQSNMLPNGGTNTTNVNSNLLSPNFIVQNNNFPANSNCFRQPINAANNANNQPNNLKFLSKRKNKRQTIVKRKFTDSEDIALASLVEIHGQNNWKLIARNMPSDRTPRQCRERWKYYLSEGLPNNDDWTHEEEKLLLEKYEIYGPHWAKIAKFFEHKNDINLKNRFNKIKRNKLSGMLFDPSMSEDFDNATREKPPNNFTQKNFTTMSEKSNTTNTSPNNEYSNESDSEDDGQNNCINDSNIKKNEENQAIQPSNTKNYFSPLYFSNGIGSSQSLFSMNSDSSSIQSSASSGKSSSNTSMLNSANPEIKFPIVVNAFNKDSKKEKTDSSESGNNSTSPSSIDGNSEKSNTITSIGIDDKSFRNNGQYSVQSLLLNSNEIEKRSVDNEFMFQNANNAKQQTVMSKPTEGYHKIIELPLPISLL